MIKIAYIIDTIVSPTAGTEKQLLMLLFGLDRTQFEPTLVCLKQSDWLKEQSFPFDLEVLNLGSLLSPSFVRAILRFRRLQRRKRFDIAQTFFVDANIFGSVAARFAGIKSVVSSRRNIGYWHTRLYTMALRFLRRWTPFYLANSKAVVETTTTVEGVDPFKITVIHNGLELDRYRELPDDAGQSIRKAWGIDGSEILIGAVANLRPVKNIESLILAAEALVDEFQNLRFVVIGDGPLRSQLQQRIDAAGLTERFQLVGAYTDIVPCLAALDIAVLCSKSESFSNSLVEYMAAGLPIVASDVGGNAEAITHEESGLLYSSHDQTGLVRELTKMLQDRSEAGRLGAVAKKTAFERYQKENCIRNHEEYYKRVAGYGGRK